MPTIGTTLGPYRLISELGSGGMGRVYLAQQEQGGQSGADGRVALKVLHPHLLEDPVVLKRFSQEARIGSRIAHQNVVRTLDVGQAESDGQACHYLVMELVEGQRLSEFLENLGSVPEALLREIAKHLLTGLEEIHGHGVVHRDLKPENVLITPEHEIRIMDLGVAKLLEVSQHITGEGEFAGSLLYAAPEQFRGESVGPAADLYALGVLLFELATGENPFKRDTAAGVIQAHVNLIPPRIDELEPSVSPLLSELVATMIAKDPADRFKTARDVLSVLADGEDSKWWHARMSMRSDRLLRLPLRKETSLHGRATELARLRTAWTSAQRGRGATVFVEGEAGIGKTHLIEEFLRDVQAAGVRVLYGACEPSDELAGVLDGIRAEFGGPGLAERIHPYLRDVPGLVPAFVALLNHELPPADSGPLSGEAIRALCVRFMKSLADERPLVWIVEDLSAASRESREMVLSMARAVRECRVLLVLTSRPGVPEHEISTLGRLARFERFELPRLESSQIVSMLEDAFRNKDLAQQLGARIAEKSDGVPFFVLEIVRGLRAGQFITQLPDGSFVQTQQIEGFEVPDAVRDLIKGRLVGLSERQRAVLDLASVVGVSFDVSLLATALDSKRIHVLQTLAEVERRFGLVHGETDGCVFDHSQLRDVLYGALMPELRREYHTLLARTHLAICESSGSEPDPVLVAHHFLHGTEPLSAGPYLDRAMVKLQATYQEEATRSLIALALQTPGLLSNERRASLLVHLAERLDLLGRSTEARAALDEARDIAAEVGDDRLGARVGRRLGIHIGMTKGGEGALEVLEEALALARRAGDVRLESAIIGNLGTVHLSLGRHEEAREHFEHRRRICEEHDDVEGAAAATANLGNVYWHVGEFQKAQACHEVHLATSKGSGDRYGEAIATGNVAHVLSALGQYSDSRRLDARYYELSSQIGFRQGEAIAVGNMGDDLTRIGRFRDARARYEQSSMISLEIGDVQGEAQAIRGLANLAFLQGDPESAASKLTKAIAVQRELGDPEGLAATLLALARAERMRGDDATAGRLLEEALEAGSSVHSPDVLILTELERVWLHGTGSDAVEELLVRLGRRLRHATRVEAHFRLWQLGGARQHLHRASQLLVEQRQHLSESDFRSMVENVPLVRELALEGEGRTRPNVAP